MILDITTQEFSKLRLEEKKKVFEQFIGNKVNEVCKGSMTNGTHGEYKIKHNKIEYSRIKIEPIENKTHMMIFDYSQCKWVEEYK